MESHSFREDIRANVTIAWQAGNSANASSQPKRADPDGHSTIRAYCGIVGIPERLCGLATTFSTAIPEYMKSYDSQCSPNLPHADTTRA
jgi:hypothetical protein